MSRINTVLCTLNFFFGILNIYLGFKLMNSESLWVGLFNLTAAGLILIQGCFNEKLTKK